MTECKMKTSRLNMEKIKKLSGQNLLCGLLLFIYQFGYANELIISTEVEKSATRIDKFISTVLMKNKHSFFINLSQKAESYDQWKLTIDGKDYTDKMG